MKALRGGLSSLPRCGVGLLGLLASQLAFAQAKSASPSPALLGKLVVEIARAQAGAPDPAWHPDQRDCAGLVRFAYKSAYQRLLGERFAGPLWRDSRGAPSAFADAETLLDRSFVLLGRDATARRELKSGDLVAFRQESPDGAEPVHHLMIVERAEQLWVIYHPGAPDEAVRIGTLDGLERQAPLEWKPVPENQAFLGFYRFREWKR
jgi:uncharacterized protein YfaT (DUF1175 family)